MRKIARSLAELGDALGRSKQAVDKWVKDPRWDQKRRAPFDVLKAAAWARVHLQENRNPGRLPGVTASDVRGIVTAGGDEDSMAALAKSPERIEKLRLVIARRAAIELETRIKTGELISREDVEQRTIRQIHELRRAFEGLGNEQAPALLGLADEQSIAETINRRVRQILNTFADGVTANGSEKTGAGEAAET